MEQEIIDLLASFIKSTEYAEKEVMPYEIMLVDDIFDFVKEDDADYAMRIKPDSTFGMYYISSEGKQLLLIKKTDNVVEVVHNLFHELIHIYDFNMLAIETGTGLRELQDNTFFILWSEFHSEYCSYLYLADYAKANINPQIVQKEFVDKMNAYLGKSRQMYVQDVADFCVRQYGQFIALYTTFPDAVDKYPMHFFVNEAFLELFKYLDTHRTYESICGKHNELKKNI